MLFILSYDIMKNSVIDMSEKKKYKMKEVKMMDTKMTRRLNLQFAVMQGLYWMAYCALYGFASSFLLGNQFENKAIGMITAIANVFAVFLQPYLGDLVDKLVNVTLKKVMTMLLVSTLVLVGCVYVFRNNMWGLAISFTLANVVVLTIQPLLNSFIYEYVNRGFNVNYGATRGVGSLSYALISYALGRLLTTYSPMLLPTATAFFVILMLAMLPLFPKLAETSQEKEAEEEAKRESYMDFLKKYHRLIPLMVAIVFIYTTHTFVNTYMLQIVESLHGTNASLGTATMISALSELPVMFGFAWLVKKVSSGNLLKISAIMYAVRCLIMIIAANVGTIYVAQLFQALSFAIFNPASVYYMNLIMEDADKVKGQTLMIGATTLGGVLGNALGGIILDVTSVKVMLILGLIAAVVALAFYQYSIDTKLKENELVVE